MTPKQIENLVETCGGDTDMVDGYDELPPEFQEKVKFALENGHVPDEDWKGVRADNVYWAPHQPPSFPLLVGIVHGDMRCLR